MSSIHDRLGVERVINAHGTVTVLGGSVMAPAVLAAMAGASQGFVDVALLHHRAAAHIADVLGVEAACITSGASAGLTVATAALLARGRPEVLASLPTVPVLDAGPVADRVVVLASHRMAYDRAILVAGAQLAEVGPDRFAEVVAGPGVAIAFYAAHAADLPGSLSLQEFAATAHRHGVPVLVDAAAELPPETNVHRFLAEGADLVVFSGGKEIGGPQSSGLVLGSATMTEWCRTLVTPYDGVTRGMKIDKETIAGLMTAVELWWSRDHAAVARSRQEAVDTVVSALGSMPGVTAWTGHPSTPGVQPVGIPRAYLRHEHRTADDLRDALRAGRPAIAVGVEDDRIAVNPQCLQPGDLEPLVAGLVAAFSR